MSDFGCHESSKTEHTREFGYRTADLAMIVDSRLYEQGKFSLGQAAEVAGLTKRAFAELLGKYNVSIFNYRESDLSRDVANA